MTNLSSVGTNFALAVSKPLVQYSSLFLFIFFLVLLTIRVIKQAKLSDLFTSKESKWLLLILLMMIPVAFIGRFVLAGSDVTTSVGTMVAVVCFPLGLIPLFCGVGLIGLIPSLLLAVITGLLQAGMFNQDPIHGLIYAIIVLTFCSALNRLKGESKEIPNSALFLASLVAVGVGVIGVILTQYVNLLSAGMLNLQRFSENVFYLSIALLIAIGIASLATIMIKYYFPDEWTPTAYLLPYTTFNPVAFTLESIEHVSRGDFEANFGRKGMTREELKLSRAFEKLQKQTSFNSDRQAKLLDLDPVSNAKQDLDGILGAILRACLNRDCKSARLVLNGNEQLRQNRQWGEGEFAQSYAYFDAMVLERIKGETQLVLNDLKREQFSGLSPESPFPHSLMALNLESKGSSIGVLWVGYEKNHWFNQEEIQFYDRLKSRIQLAIIADRNHSQLEVDRGLLLAALESMDNPIFILDAENRIYYLNQKAIQLAAEERDLLRGSEDRKVIGLAELQTQINNRSLQTRAPLIQIGKDKEFEALVRPLTSSGDQKGKLLLLRDTSWVKKVSQQKNEYVANISHDLRVPLTRMKGYVSIIQGIGYLSDEQNINIVRLQDTINQISQLVDKVLSLEQLDNEGILQYSSFGIRELIQESVKMISLSAQQRKVTIQVDFDNLKAVDMNADRVMLQQAVFNLLENAVKFSYRGGEVQVDVSNDRNTVHVVIADHGKGIAPLDQPKLFSRFFQVEDDRFGSGGQGLGLAIVKSIATRHGGSVSVNSQLGVGSVFHLEIPIKKN